jgi:hypothetical protein
MCAAYNSLVYKDIGCSHYVQRTLPDCSFCPAQSRMQGLKLALSKMVSLGITGYLEALVKNER